jgi:hypothetical protein
MSGKRDSAVLREVPSMSGPKEGLATTQIETVQLKVGLVLIHTRASAGDPGTPDTTHHPVETG